MSTTRNRARSGEPLDARSLALSALLGSHPPVLPARALTALAELFGIAGGTMRTALSRMVAAGELSTAGGRYRLEGRLLDRQRAQDLGRRDPAPAWDGRWHTLVALDSRRPLAERRRVRRTLTDRRLGELRPDVWMRPANLPAPSIDGWACITGPLSGADPRTLAASLWDLGSVATAATDVLVDLHAVTGAIATRELAAIPRTFQVAAQVVRVLRSDPLLPTSLLPDGWPVDQLRATYDQVEADLQATVRTFFAALRHDPTDAPVGHGPRAS